MSMVIDTLQILFTRDLTRLKNELEQYPNEPDIWKIKGQINNSAGNLCLHLIFCIKYSQEGTDRKN